MRKLRGKATIAPIPASFLAGIFASAGFLKFKLHEYANPFILMLSPLQVAVEEGHAVAAARSFLEAALADRMRVLPPSTFAAIACEFPFPQEPDYRSNVAAR
jgi:hypothetical protein